MGPASDPMAVVDQYGRVHGLQGLRVVDASVMPDVVRANTNATTIMMPSAWRIGSKRASKPWIAIRCRAYSSLSPRGEGEEVSCGRDTRARSWASSLRIILHDALPQAGALLWHIFCSYT